MSFQAVSLVVKYRCTSLSTSNIQLRTSFAFVGATDCCPGGCIARGPSHSGFWEKGQYQMGENLWQIINTF